MDEGKGADRIVLCGDRRSIPIAPIPTKQQDMVQQRILLPTTTACTTIKAHWLLLVAMAVGLLVVVPSGTEAWMRLTPPRNQQRRLYPIIVTTTARRRNISFHRTSPRSSSRRSRSPFSKFSDIESSSSVFLVSSSTTTADEDSNVLSHAEIQRYSRHLVLSQVGVRGQLALRDASVLVIGAGGLGSPVLLYLAAAGVGHIGIVDADTVDTSNLQRQIIHSTSSSTTTPSTSSMTKCASARDRIHQLNPHVKVRLYEMEFTAATAPTIVRDGFFHNNNDNNDNNKPWTVVMDGSDNFPTKYLINDICAMHGIPWIYSAILAFEGQVSVFNMPLNDDSTTTTAAAVSRGPDYRDLLPTPPDPGDVPSCAEGGVLGVLPGTMGCIQATEAIKLILGHTVGLLVGRVLVFDAMAMKFSEIGLSRTPDRVPIVSLIDYQGFCGGPKQQQSQITPPMLLQSPPGAAPVRRTMDEADANEDADATTTTSEMAANSFRTISPRDCWDKLRNEEWTPWVVDVRLETEHVICHLPFTDCVIPHRRILEPHARMPSTGDVLVYCKAGSRGATACRNLVASGRIEPNRLYNLQGGILQWQKDIDPSIPRY